MDRKIRVYRDTVSGAGELVSEHDLPSDAIRAAIKGKREAPDRALCTKMHWVAFPIVGGSGWDIWYA